MPKIRANACIHWLPSASGGGGDSAGLAITHYILRIAFCLGGF